MEENTQTDEEFDWDLLNIENKYEICISLLKKAKRQNSLMFVENKNLKNTIKNMENELRGAKDALRAEECKFVQLNEKLKSKMKERQEFKVKEQKLSYSVIVLQSKLQKERSKRALLEERIKIGSQEQQPLRVVSQRFSQVMDRLRRSLGRRRNSVQDQNHIT